MNGDRSLVVKLRWCTILGSYMTEILIVNRLPEPPADHVMKLLSMTTCMVGCISVGLRFKYLPKIPSRIVWDRLVHNLSLPNGWSKVAIVQHVQMCPIFVGAYPP